MHSGNYIDSNRLDWWDPDWIRHIANIFEFTNIKHVCDLGAGAGHWVQVLAQALPWRDTAVVALDSDEGWVDVLRRNASLADSVSKFNVVHGDATQTGLPSNSFDLVTCQTLALHLANPEALVKEMIRLAKPGGLVVLAEPINIINRCQFGAAIGGLEPEEAGLLVEIWTAYHRGVRELTSYDYDIALRLETIIKNCGVNQDEISCYKNPKIVKISSGDNLCSEYNDLNFEYAQRGGIDLIKWEQGQRLTEKMSHFNENFTFMDSLFLFIFRVRS